MKTVIIIAPHPDDESFIGGTILKHKDECDQVICIFITNGNEHQKQIIPEITKFYGFEFMYHFDINENMKNDIGLIIPDLTNVFNHHKPNIIYMPFYGDIHSDHRIIHEAAMSCIKPFRFPSIEKVLMMEIISQTELGLHPFKPNYYIDISPYIESKINAFKYYEKEMGKHPFPRSYDNIKRMAQLRGSECNCNFAESFILIKQIIK